MIRKRRFKKCRFLKKYFITLLNLTKYTHFFKLMIGNIEKKYFYVLDLRPFQN